MSAADPGPDLRPDDQRQLERWWAEVVRMPHVLPDDVAHVQSRLVRAVGRGTLPSGREVFLKLMGFPRAKDRLRYCIRKLPGVHEADVLRYLATTEVRVPDVLFAAGQRRRGLPHASLLVTAALPVAEGRLDPAATVEVVFALREAGVFHPDLHTDNFLPLEDGAIAVIDMQSARRRRNIQLEDMRRMCTTLIAHCAYKGMDTQPWLAALRARDFDELSVGQIARMADHVNQRATVDRLRRCLKESTQFQTSTSLYRSRFERRELAGKGDWVEGGEEMFRYWMGDRALEILQGGTPVLAAFERPARLMGGAHRVRLEGGAAALQQHAPRLLDGYELYEERISRKV